MSILSFFRETYSQHRSRFTLVTLCLLIASFLELVSLATLIPLIGSLIENQTFQEGNTLKFLSVLGIENLSISNLLFIILFFMIARTCLMFVSYFLAGTMSAQIERDIRQKVFHSVMFVKWPFFTKQKAGRLNNILTIESNKAGLASQHLAKFFVFSVLSFFFLSAAALISWKAFIISILLSAPLLFIASIVHKKTRQRAIQRVEASNNCNSQIIETLAQIKQIKASNIEENTANRFEKTIDNIKRLQVKDIQYQSITAVLPDGLTIIVLAGLIGLIYSFNLASVGDLFFFLLIMFRAQRFIGQTQNMQQKLNANLPSYQICKQLINDANKEKENLLLAKTFNFNKSISVENISFGYNKDTLIVDDLSLSLPKNGTIAFVGKSGSGKTTLIDLIMGLLSPHKGCIKIDDALLGHKNMRNWRQMTSYVPQEPILFNGTIRENILRDISDVTEDGLQDILDKTLVSEFLNNKEMGLDTPVGDRGIQLSGGQKQRIALARALIKKPSVLILDEATSALDNQSEKEIRDSLQALHGQQTIMIIAHRLSSVKEADTIYVMDQGKIVESGSFEDLKKQEGLFQSLDLAANS